MELAVLVLAAGSSSRLGEPKQLLQYKDKTLIQIAVEKALEVSPNVTVILGANADTIIQEIILYPISIVINHKYYKGIGNSISYGLSSIEEFNKTLIMLCDQPFIPLSHFEKILRESEIENEIVCSLYNEKLAVPALFPKKYYNLLINLKGDHGAKQIIKENSSICIPLENKYAIDIDTKEDLKNYIN